MDVWRGCLFLTGRKPPRFSRGGETIAMAGCLFFGLVRKILGPSPRAALETWVPLPLFIAADKASLRDFGDIGPSCWRQYIGGASAGAVLGGYLL